MSRTKQSNVQRVKATDPVEFFGEVEDLHGAAARPAGSSSNRRRRLWVSEPGEDTVTAIDPASNRVVGNPIRVGRQPQGIAADGDALWVVALADGTVSRLDLRSGRLTGRPVRVGGVPTSVAVGREGIWAEDGEGTATRIDPQTNRRIGAPIPIGDDTNGSSVALAGGSAWFTNFGGDSVTRIEPSRSDRP